MDAANGGARVAVVGATGTVGSQIAELIGARDFPCEELKLFAAESGVTSEGVESGGRTLPVSRLESPDQLSQFDVALLAIPQNAAAEIINARPGPALIDLSAATRAPFDAAPLVAPGLTARERVRELKRFKVFAVPHPAAQVIATILKAVGALGGPVAATVMLSASSAGRESVSELFNQSADLLNAHLDIEENGTQTAFNVFLPADGRELAYAITAQATALMDAAPALTVGVVRVPAFHGSGIALSMPAAANTGEWSSKLRSAPGVILVESDVVSSFVDAVGQEAVIVRMTANAPETAALWCVFDNARLAALSAVWIAEALSSGS